MNRRRVIIAVSCVAVLTIGFFAWPSHTPPEPVYQGKSLSQWLSNYDITKPPIIQTPLGPKVLSRETDEAFRAMGTNAIPHLLRILRQHDSNLKIKLVGLAQRQNIVKVEFIPANKRKPWVRDAFCALGAQGQPAVAGLIDVCEHGPDAVSRSMAAWALFWIGPAASNAVPVLVHGATNLGEDPGVRGDCINAIRQIGGDATIVPVLIQMLKEPTGSGPIGAIGMLFRINAEAAKPAVPALFDFLKTINNDPKKFPNYDVPLSLGGVKGVNTMVRGLIEHLDAETAAARKSELDAYMKSGDSQ